MCASQPWVVLSGFRPGVGVGGWGGRLGEGRRGNVAHVTVISASCVPLGGSLGSPGPGWGCSPASHPCSCVPWTCPGVQVADPYGPCDWLLWPLCPLGPTFVHPPLPSPPSPFPFYPLAGPPPPGSPLASFQISPPHTLHTCGTCVFILVFPFAWSEFPVAAVTSDRRLGGFKQQKQIFSPF